MAAKKVVGLAAATTARYAGWAARSLLGDGEPEPPPASDASELGTDEAMRPAGWYARVTDHGIGASLLDRARRDGRLHGYKRGGRWHYPVNEVGRLWPAYETSIRKADETARNRTGKPNGTERNRTEPDIW